MPAAVEPGRGRPQSLRRGVSWSLVGTLVYSASQWLALSVLAKLGDRRMVGQYTLGLAMTTPVVLFANLSLSSLLVTDARRDYRFHEYLGLRLFTTALAILPLAGVALLGGYPRATAIVVFIVGLSKAIDAITDILTALLQQRERMDLLARTSAANGVISLLCITALLRATGDITWGTAGTALGSLAALTLSAWPAARAVLRASRGDEADRRARPSLDPHRALGLAREAAPLGVVTMLLSVNSAVPRYFLERHAGEASVGTYSALAAFMVVGTMVTAAMGQTASPRLAAYAAAGDRRSFQGLVLKMAAATIALGAAGLGVAALLGRPILTLVYRAEYAEHEGVFLWLMGAALANQVASVLGVAVTAMRLFRPQVPVHVLNTTLGTLCFAVLVPSHGLLGAAWATFAVAALYAVTYLALAAFGLRGVGRAAAPGG